MIAKLIISLNKFNSSGPLFSKIQAKITHNALEKSSNIISVIRNSKPKIIETSNKVVSNKKFKIKGVGKEETLLTITKTENSFFMMNQALQTLATSVKEIVIGTVYTDNEGNWELDVPISAAGQYSFKIYEN